MEVLKEITRLYSNIINNKSEKDLTKKDITTSLYLASVENLDKETCEQIKLYLKDCKDKKIQKLLKILHPQEKRVGTIDGYFTGDSNYIFETNDKYLRFQVLLKKQPTPENYMEFIKTNFKYMAKELQKGKSNIETNIKTKLHTFLDMDISKFLELFYKELKPTGKKSNELLQSCDEKMSEQIKKNSEILKQDKLGNKLLEYNSDASIIQNYKNSMALINCYNSIKNHKSANTSELKNIINNFSITKFRERQLPDNLKNLENFHYECNDEIPCMVKKLLEKEIYALNFIRDKDIFENGLNKFIKNCEDIYNGLLNGDHEMFLIGVLYSQYSNDTREVFNEYFEQMDIKEIELLKEGIIDIEAFVEFSKKIHEFCINVKN